MKEYHDTLRGLRAENHPAALQVTQMLADLNDALARAEAAEADRDSWTRTAENLAVEVRNAKDEAAALRAERDDLYNCGEMDESYYDGAHCAWCGHYAANNDEAKAHLVVCSEHPMAAVVAANKRLLGAGAALIDALDGRDSLAARPADARDEFEAYRAMVHAVYGTDADEIMHDLRDKEPTL